MDELGGPVDDGGLPQFDNSYVIPKEFAMRWAREVLEQINQSRLDKPDSV